MAKKYDVLICSGAACLSNHSKELKGKLEELIKKHKNYSDINIIETGCMGPCELGPLMVVYPEGVFYQRLKTDDIEEIFEEHFLKGRIVHRCLYKGATATEIIHSKKQEIPFFSKQKKIVLKNSGEVNPTDLEEYIAADGYEALEKVLGMTSDEVLEKIKISGLRGRGGGGFPTALKWKLLKEAKSSEKYVVCNADEGDPGAFMDRALLEGDPFSVIEGMTICAYTVGAAQGYVYVRAEYPLAIERLETALEKSRQTNLLGKNILETGFDFDLEVRVGAGAFVCGEETALMHSIEGKRGVPTPRPPYPSEKGLWDNPTSINNVETFGNIRHIINMGAENFTSIGTEKSKGTKVFALSGNVHNTGLVEVPMGTTIRELVYDIGGGIPNGKKFKAVQIGGPAGGCIPEQYIDTPIDYESLNSLGAIMGSGGLIVIDEDTCMVNLAKYFIDFSAHESCGKCPPCRVGVKQMQRILEKITSGRGRMEDIESLKELGETIKLTSLCGLGQGAPNPVLTTLKYFRDEYEAHVKDGECPALVCKDLIHFSIDQEKCVGCHLCHRACPVDAIVGELKGKHKIVQDKCIKCGSCYDVCRFDSVLKLPGNN